MAGSDAEFVDADGGGCRWTGKVELLLHIKLVNVFDGLPVQTHFLRNVGDRRGPAASAHGENEALGVTRIVGEPVEMFAFHPALRTLHATVFELQKHGATATIEIASTAREAVIRATIGCMA